MKRFLYFSVTPEALIASMLPPAEFGNYLAVGTKKRTRGQAIFFEVEPDFESDFFPLKEIEERCVAHQNGEPKRSVYLSIYRVLENLPLKSLKNLYLTTDDGRVLELEKSEFSPGEEEGLHLYQQLSPVTPRIASQLNPVKFMKLVTDRSRPVSVPKLFFTELKLNDLATDPLKGSVDDLPYLNIDHLRDCLVGLQANPNKPTKTVIRFFQGNLLFRTIRNGFFIGEGDNILYYKFPEKEELENKYYTWWRSALTIGF